MQENLILANCLLCPNMEIRSQAPRKWFFSEIFDFYGKVSEFRF